MAPHSSSRKQVKRLLAKATQLANGFQKHGSLLPAFPVNGVEMTAAQALARLQQSLAAEAAADALKNQLTLALVARDKTVLGDEDFIVNLPVAVRSALGSTPKLQVFGIPYGKTRKQRTSVEEAISAALRLRTRKVRGTMGRRQRAAVTTEGRPGLIVVDPTGEPIAGGRPPVAPGKKPSK